jgi:hypothetical protein
MIADRKTRRHMGRGAKALAPAFACEQKCRLGREADSAGNQRDERGYGIFETALEAVGAAKLGSGLDLAAALARTSAHVPCRPAFDAQGSQVPVRPYVDSPSRRG